MSGRVLGRMSWTNFLLHDFWTAREVNRLDEERRVRRRARRRRRRRRIENKRALEARLEEVEGDLAEATLLLRALSDVCVQKGLVTADELVERAEYLDGLDGVVDGRMGEPQDAETESEEGGTTPEGGELP